MKTCSKCGIEKPLDMFPKDKRVKRDGREARCKKCRNSYTTEWGKTNKKRQEYRKGYNKKWREDNKEKKLEYNRMWNKTSAGKAYKNMKCAERRSKKLNATLPGYEEEIKHIYKTCPEGHHVDHIIPLQGNNVSGLHVPWNLQHLPATENFKKGNKLCESYL